MKKTPLRYKVEIYGNDSEIRITLLAFHIDAVRNQTIIYCNRYDSFTMRYVLINKLRNIDIKEGKVVLYYDSGYIEIKKIQ